MSGSEIPKVGTLVTSPCFFTLGYATDQVTDTNDTDSCLVPDPYIHPQLSNLFIRNANFKWGID